MKRSVAALLGVAIMATFALVTSASGAPTARNPYIVVLRSGSPTAHAAEYGLTPTNVYRAALRGYAAKLTGAQLRQLQADGRVSIVAQDRTISVGDPKITFATLQDQIVPTGVDRVEADVSRTADIDGVDERVNADVAIIDTGVDVEHPDINLRGGVNCIAPAPQGTAYDDRNGHGTHVAGTVAAIDNAFGVVGVAPGARIWAARVLNSAGSGTFASVICGVDWVTAHASTIDVANMSLGGTGLPDDGNCGRTVGDPLHLAICNSVAAGVTYTVSAGNAAADIDATDTVPANYDEVITVSALADFDGQPGGLGEPTCRNDEDDTFANFSNFGSDVDVIAPGVCIVSSFPRDRQLGDKAGYGAISGTSMSSPHAAGAAALYLSTHPAATPAQVRTALVNAGSFDWDDTDDPDTTKEPLIDVSGF